MEPHPVPQNFLDTQFKLFGAFTLKQFIRILLGGLIAVGIFVININFLIKLPLILGALAFGVLAAFIPGFEKQVGGYIRAIFISPRYVWTKQKVIPEILYNPTKKDTKNDQNIESALDKKLIDLNTLPLEKLFGSAMPTVIKDEQDSMEQGKENVNAVYEDVFGKDIVNTERKIDDYEALPVAPKVQIPAKSVEGPRFKSIEEYKREIERLKFELSKYTGKDSAKERLITDQINELFMEVKLIVSDSKYQTTASVQNKLNHMTPEQSGKILAGVVVGKKDEPIDGGVIDFVNEGRVAMKVQISQDGKFVMPNPIPFGVYEVKIIHPTKRFHTYKIQVGEGNPTGYKFREK